MIGRVLTVAGSDSGGGAGIQADLKTITALGGFGMSAITALTAQNTLGVFGVEAVSPAFVRQQIQVVLRDLGADCCKSGMLANAAVVHALADELQDYPELPFVLDPVMVSTSGSVLLDPEAVDAVMTRLLPRALVVTPNIPEAEVMTGHVITDLDGMRSAARVLQDKGAGAVLLKGGHLRGDELEDLLVFPEGHEIVLRGERIKTRHTHGTGCTLASAIATGVAQGMGLEAAVRRGNRYLRLALLCAPGLGQGHGPVDHGVTIRPEWHQS
ncbi:bifunctional hydroxymethylpyrimidine kinase/phosphomethylpyrimidine kinase [Gluconobacter thailandicus]|uniref:hydroxymethylpyrimidine kinase n=1 Tax=Gluconobacter thailandicus TaxID=257438 RepID=A0AAP9ET50_GLUTH|nr:bifunctional hydroxymethylpyrimidine kinase/phosphomethylpyrimidine kinase [Gluconobacter thailandicus]KXV32569.1 phosphomethylpyrimidine kinase [Gluconobacter thailandicus]QEH96375.1 bifunctional hydroxymethylpyrimidine kinase/phosphomethylpyrimidine kinase [Gluconobacter thailandicus]